MRFSRSLLIIIPLGVLASACVSGRPFESSQSVAIATTPEGALASSNYGDTCVTPCKLRLLSGSGGTITVEKEGYETQEIEVGVEPSGTKKALLAADTALTAIDPTPIDVIVAGMESLIDGRGETHKLALRDVYVVMKEIDPSQGTNDEQEIDASQIQHASREAEETDTSSLF